MTIMIKRLLLGLYTVYMWFLFGLAFLSHFLVGPFYTVFSVDKARSNFVLAQFFLRTVFFLSGIHIQRLRLSALQQEHHQVILASNHQSHVDIAILMAAMDGPFFFFAKDELLRIPILASAIRQQRHIVVNRSKPREAIKQLEHVKRSIEDGRSMLIFPEGTRSVDGQIQPLKRGAFVVAVQTGAPIIPVYIEGANQLIKKGCLTFCPASITVKMGDPIMVSKTTKPVQIKFMSEELKDKVYHQLVELKKV